MTISRQFNYAPPPAWGRLARRLRRILRPAAGRLGYVRPDEVLHDLPPADFRGLGLHPAEALARAGGLRFVLDLPLAWCRGHRAAAFACAPGAMHPYLETARALLADGGMAWAGSPLHRFHRHFRPRDAAELLGIEATHPALKAPPEAAFFPWETPPTPEALARRRADLEAENRSHGLALDAGHGFHHFGPVSDEKGRLELTRLTRVLAAIRDEGFRLLPGPSGLCTARILCRGEDWRALVVNGQHRVAALAALGHDAAPMLPLPGPVRREEAETWPGVRAGVFTPAQALAVFDRVFAARQPAALARAYFDDPAAPGRQEGAP
jgi:hypothetical protein